MEIIFKVFASFTSRGMLHHMRELVLESLITWLIMFALYPKGKKEDFTPEAKWTPQNRRP